MSPWKRKNTLSSLMFAAGLTHDTRTVRRVDCNDVYITNTMRSETYEGKRVVATEAPFLLFCSTTTSGGQRRVANTATNTFEIDLHFIIDTGTTV